MVAPPKYTGKSSSIDLTGMLFAYDKAQQTPLLINIQGSDHNYWPFFDDSTHLKRFMGEVFSDFSIKQIENHLTFITESYGSNDWSNVILIVNPRATENGKTKWMQLGSLIDLKKQTLN